MSIAVASDRWIIRKRQHWRAARPEKAGPQTNSLAATGAAAQDRRQLLVKMLLAHQALHHTLEATSEGL